MTEANRMTIDQYKNDTQMRLAISGRLDTMSSPELDEVVNTGLDVL